MRGPTPRARRPIPGLAGPARPRLRARHGRGRGRGLGLATLATVLGLLALAAWAAAASQRAVLGELRAAASHMRASEAFEAAQGGLEFTLALLQAGPLDAACRPAQAPLPSLADRLESGTVELGCQRLEAGWACQCPPTAGDAAAAAGVPASAVPAFRVEARQIAKGATVQVRATGQGSGGPALATLSMRASPREGTSPPTWHPVPGSWRDF